MTRTAAEDDAVDVRLDRGRVVARCVAAIFFVPLVLAAVTVAVDRYFFGPGLYGELLCSFCGLCSIVLGAAVPAVLVEGPMRAVLGTCGAVFCVTAFGSHLHQARQIADTLTWWLQSAGAGWRRTEP